MGSRAVLAEFGEQVAITYVISGLGGEPGT
jgi:hypothetical protein